MGLDWVKTFNPRLEAMTGASSRRFVRIAAPTIHAGVGDALREAFAPERETRMPKMFEELLAKLG